MSDSEEDLEALFDEVSADASNKETPAAKPQVTNDGSADTEKILPKFNFDNDDESAAKPMFDRVGNLVRMMHDSMRELGFDRTLSEVATQVSDSKDRLEYIATLTEQAATKVLNATDQGMPAQDELAGAAKDIETRWTSLFEGKTSVADFKVLAKDSHNFATKVIAATDAEKARLLDIMMSQDFQDLTGQLIKKVNAINKMVERELAQMLIDNAPSELKEKAVELMEGPSVPNTALGQDDVDNLLDSLGF